VWAPSAVAAPLDQTLSASAGEYIQEPCQNRPPEYKRGENRSQLQTAPQLGELEWVM
jgi:hypothetical protein